MRERPNASSNGVHSALYTLAIKGCKYSVAKCFHLAKGDIRYIASI